MNDSGGGWSTYWDNNTEIYVRPDGVEFLRTTEDRADVEIHFFGKGLPTLYLRQIGEHRKMSKTEKSVTNICKKCGNEIPPTGKRGRPSKICADCKNPQNLDTEIEDTPETAQM